MEEIIKAYISKELITNPALLPLSDDTSLVESGLMDSLSLLKLLLFLEENFNIQIGDYEVVPESFDSVQKICAYIRSRKVSEEV